MVDEVIGLIQKLPPYFCYIYPGYISLFLYHHFRGINLNETKAKVIKSIVISYIYIFFLKLFTIPTFIKIDDNLYIIIFNIILSIVSILTAYILYLFTLNKTIPQKLRKLKIYTTFYQNEIECLERYYNDSLRVYVYLKNSRFVYEGTIISKELEDGKNKFICLNRYRRYRIDEEGTKKLKRDNSDDEYETVVMYLSEISHLEIVKWDDGINNKVND